MLRARANVSPEAIMNGHRDWGSPSEEHQPMTWLHGHAIYAAHLIVVVLVASLLVTTILMGFQNYTLLHWLHFNSALVLDGQVWRVFTYGLWNQPSLSFVIDMFMIVWFGREVEKFFGRGKFLFLYGAIYLLSPLALTAVGTWFPYQLTGERGAFALFVAFATLYPSVPVFFNILAKWLAIVLVGLYSLMSIANHDHAGLISLLSTCGFAFAFVRYEQGAITLPKLRLRRRKPRLRVLPDLPKQFVAAPTAKQVATMAEVDALLDKIAKTGMASLTPKERAKLEAAREGLMKRGGRT
jgi:membrane associated rhomboid family serine protease